MRVWWCTPLSLLLAVPMLYAQTPPATPCSSEAFRQLDFWVGEWHAEWQQPDGSVGTGTNRVTKDEFGSCVIYERFSAPGLNGMSVSTFHNATAQWRQTWVDDQGGYFALVGGPSDDPAIEFMLEVSRLSDESPHLRMIWQDVEPQTFTWRWQGRASEEDAWQDRWVIRYTRDE
ncbi:MAG: hypothetical protein AAF265_16295 [Pseudomonadota bacterium]